MPKFVLLLCYYQSYNFIEIKIIIIQNSSFDMLSRSSLFQPMNLLIVSFHETVYKMVTFIIQQFHFRMNNRVGAKALTTLSSKPSDRASYPSSCIAPKISFTNSSIHTLQFKNAIYYGQATQNKMKNGVGVVIYDSGNILISKFSQNSMEGPFIYYDCGRNLCFYGQIQNQLLNGHCYVMNRNYHYVQQSFCNGIREKGCYVFNKFKVVAFNNQNSTTSHKIVFLSDKSQKNSNQGNGCLNFQPTLLNPTQFLLTYFPQQQQSKFKLYQMDRVKSYFGFRRNNKPEGVGLIFMDQWPVCYGNFIEGKLNGQGKVQQNKFITLDGIFNNNLLTKGWIINLKQNKMCFGTQIINNYLQKQQTGVQQIDDKYFKIKQQFFNANYSLVQKFIRQQHLQSLNFINSYVADFSNKIIPQFNQIFVQYIQNQTYQEYIEQQTAEQNFIPSFISQIQQINDRSRKATVHKVQRQLIELIRQHNEDKKVFIKNSKLIQQKLKRDSDIYESEQKKDKLLNNVIKEFKSKQKNVKSPQKPNGKAKPKRYLNLKNVNRQQQNNSQKIVIKEKQIVNSPQKIKTTPPNKFDTLQKKNQNQRVTIQKKLNLHEIYDKYLKI